MCGAHAVKTPLSSYTVKVSAYYLLTYLLTPWCGVLLENLTGLQLVKKFLAIHGTRRFITALTSVRHLSLSWVNPMQSTYPHPTSWRPILILSTHLRLGLPIGLISSGFPTKTLYIPLPAQNSWRTTLSYIPAPCPAHHLCSNDMRGARIVDITVMPHPSFPERNAIFIVTVRGNPVSRSVRAKKTIRRLNPLTPNDHYSGRTAPLTSKRFILYIYSTNTDTEYFKHGIYSPFFFSSKCSLFHNYNIFGSCFIHVLYTECAKI